MLDSRFVILGAVLSLIGSLSYVVDTLKGKTKPNRVTWLLWATAPFIAFGGELGEGVGIQALTTFMAGFCPVLVLIASFVNKKAYWSITRFDIVCGILSVLALLLWVVTKTGNLAIVFSLLANGLAATPTIVKAYHEPETESSLAFLLSAISAGITLFTITTWSFANYAFPLYILVAGAILFILIKFPKFRLSEVAPN